MDRTSVKKAGKFAALFHVSIYEISTVIPKIFAPHKTRFLQTSGRCTGGQSYLNTNTVKCLALKYCSDYVNSIRPKIFEIVLGGKDFPNKFLSSTFPYGRPTTLAALVISSSSTSPRV